jgi:hypothetical protein
MRSEKLDTERVDVKNLNNVEMEQQVKISNRFAASEDVMRTMIMMMVMIIMINKAWNIIKENIKASVIESLGYYELKLHKPWYHAECSKLRERRKQAKFQWLQNPSQINGDNLGNIRREIRRNFRNK